MKPLMPPKRSIKNILAVTAISMYLTGCVGVVVSMPEKEKERIPLTYQKTDSDLTTREWCGITLWAVILPIPLKLPVCKLHAGQSWESPFYACGPLMVLGPIVHGYQGNALCGVFPQ